MGFLSFRQGGLDYIVNRYKDSARSLMEDHGKRVWIGWKRTHKTEPGSVCLYDSLGHWIGNVSPDGRIVPDRSVPFNADVYCICEDKDHNIWMGTREDGLYLFRFLGEDRYRVSRFLPDDKNPYSISSRAIFSILQDSSGRIWIGTFGGGINLVEPDPDGGLKFVHYGNILNNYPDHLCGRVRCLYEADGVMLIGTTGGLLSCSTRFSRPEAIRFFHNVCDERYSSLSNNDIMDITRTRGGKLLLTTLSGGINVLDGGGCLSDRLAFSHTGAGGGRLPDLALSCIEDKEGNVWIVQENKVSKFDAGLNLLEEYADQIQMAETKPLLLSSGRLLLGSLYGALALTPGGLRKSGFVPPLVFSRLDICQGNASRTEPIYDNRETLHLGPDERNFTVTFAALDYVNPSAIRYAYRVKGLDDRWKDLGNNRSASLVDIPAGDYLLQVKSTNADGVWVDNVTSLPLHVRPRFGETLWAALLYAVLAVVLVLAVAGIAVRITRLRRRPLQPIPCPPMQQIPCPPGPKADAAQAGQFAPSVPPATHFDDDFIHDIIRSVEQNLQNPEFKIDHLAEAMNMSRTVFYRKLKSLVGMSPVDFVKSLRIKRAAQLLEQDEYTVSEVGYLSGFATPQYFSRVFKEAMGCTPKEYRQKHKPSSV